MTTPKNVETAIEAARADAAKAIQVAHDEFNFAILAGDDFEAAARVFDAAEQTALDALRAAILYAEREDQQA